MAEAQKVDRSAAIKAWHEAKTDEERAVAVKNHPVLVEIYAGAKHHQPKADDESAPEKAS